MSRFSMSPSRIIKAEASFQRIVHGIQEQQAAKHEKLDCLKSDYPNVDLSQPHQGNEFCDEMLYDYTLRHVQG